MRELFFPEPSQVLQAPPGIPQAEWQSFLESPERRALVEGRPCFFVDGRPDDELNSFVDHLMAPRRPRSNTWKTYAHAAHVYLRHLDAQGKDWKQVNQEDINRYYFTRTTGNFQNVDAVANSSWNISANALVHLYEWAQTEGLITRLPFTYRQVWNGWGSQSKSAAEIFAKNTGELVRFISIDVYKEQWRPRILAGRNSLRNIAFCDLLTSSGLRLSEALGLTYENLPDPSSPIWAERKSCRLEVIGKGRKARTVLIPKHVIRAIHFYLESEGRPSRAGSTGRVFRSTNGGPWSARSVEHLFQSISRALGIKLVPHGCRHTFAIYQLSGLIKAMAATLKQLKESGGADVYQQLVFDPLRRLQLLLGHSHISTTFIYLNTLEEAEALVEETLADWTDWAAV